MKNSKKIVASTVLASMLSTAAIVPTAHAEVSASASVANMYLWRGFDLGDGDAAVSGDITYSAGGFYTGIWGSSGDAALGNEYDLYVGYGGEAGDFSYDVSYWTYVYPEVDIDAFDVDDLVVSLGYGPVAFTLYESLVSDSDYRYYTFDYTHNAWNFLVGNHDYGSGIDSDTHLQVSYSYNDNLSFTLSKFLDDNDGTTDDDVQFVVSYSLDIK